MHITTHTPTHTHTHTPTHTHTHLHTHTHTFMCTLEAVVSDRLHESEEIDPVLWKLLQVLVDHLQCALKQSLQDGWHFTGHLILNNYHIKHY